jgi:hypothetical protein
MTWFYATLLLEQDVPSSVDFGGSTNESVAARIALRVSNQMQRDTCVAHAVGNNGVKVTQIVRWKGFAQVEDEHEPTADENRKVLSHAAAPAAIDFIVECMRHGFTVTVSPSHEGTFNIIARK